MYKIEKKHYGVKLTFEGVIKEEEMAKWVAESRAMASTLPSKFGVFVDMRALSPLAPDAQREMQKGQKLYKKKGMERSVVILNHAITTIQFIRIAKETGIYEWERYIDAAVKKNWEDIGEKWLVNAIDPDL